MLAVGCWMSDYDLLSLLGTLGILKDRFWFLLYTPVIAKSV